MSKLNKFYFIGLMSLCCVYATDKNPCETRDQEFLRKIYKADLLSEQREFLLKIHQAKLSLSKPRPKPRPPCPRFITKTNFKLFDVLNQVHLYYMRTDFYIIFQHRTVDFKIVLEINNSDNSNNIDDFQAKMKIRNSHHIDSPIYTVDLSNYDHHPTETKQILDKIHTIFIASKEYVKNHLTDFNVHEKHYHKSYSKHSNFNKFYTSFCRLVFVEDLRMSIQNTSLNTNDLFAIIYSDFHHIYSPTLFIPELVRSRLEAMQYTLALNLAYALDTLQHMDSEHELIKIIAYSPLLDNFEIFHVINSDVKCTMYKYVEAREFNDYIPHRLISVLEEKVQHPYNDND